MSAIEVTIVVKDGIVQEVYATSPVDILVVDQDLCDEDEEAAYEKTRADVIESNVIRVY